MSGRRLFVLVSMTFGLLGATGCQNDCEKLVNYACGKIGATSSECAQARRLASGADKDDEDTCKTLHSVMAAFGGQ